MRANRDEPSGRALIAAFAGVAACFLVATLVSEYSDVKIRRDAEAIVGNAAPSIARLEGFRSEARRLVLLADDYVDQSLAQRTAKRVDVDVDVGTVQRGHRGERSATAVTAATPALADGALSRSMSRLNAEWNAYRLLPTFPREREISASVAGLMQRFVTDLQHVLDAARAGDPVAAGEILEHRVKPAADAVDDAAVKVVELNANEATRLGSRIDDLGRRSIRLAIGLDGVSVLLTILAALLVHRFMRRYTRLVENRAAELELFAGRVAHDVLSPLGAASLALSYLSERAAFDDPRARRMLALGQRSIERTRLIADDLLEFASSGARPDPGARADVRAVVLAVVEEARALADERKINLSIEDLAAGSVRCSQGILSSLVSNLVRNAVKYVGVGPGKRVVVRTVRLDAFTRIEVEDNGPGLPEAMESAVFEPYVRAPGNTQPGIGLGLATVKRVTEAHGGRVDVRSVAGAGCRFGVDLPNASEDDIPGARSAQETLRESVYEKALPPPGNPPRVSAEDEHQRGPRTRGQHRGDDRDDDRKSVGAVDDGGGDGDALDARQDTNPSGHAG